MICTWSINWSLFIDSNSWYNYCLDSNNNWTFYSTLLLLLTIFGGLELLGPWGALLGPLIVRLATEAIILVQEDEDEQLNYSRT